MLFGGIPNPFERDNPIPSLGQEKIVRVYVTARYSRPNLPYIEYSEYVDTQLNNYDSFAIRAAKKRLTNMFPANLRQDVVVSVEPDRLSPLDQGIADGIIDPENLDLK